MTNFNKDQLNQGDVTLKKISSIPEGLTLNKVEGNIVQPSETHGKFHRFAPDANVTVYDTGVDQGEGRITRDTEKFVVVGSEGAVLFHGKEFDLNPNTETDTDHAGLFVPEGTYSMVIRKEYDYDKMEESRVVD